jgi:hypothetical protein
MKAMALVARNSLQAAGHRPDSRSRNIHRVGRMSDDAFYELIAFPATMISDGRRSGRNARCGEDQGNCYCKSS